MTVAIINEVVLPRSEARLDIEDRGIQFAESVYEVILCVSGKLIDAAPHLARLGRSLAAIGIDYSPERMESLTRALDKLVAQISLHDGMVYIQITGGTAERTLVTHPRPAPTSIAYGRSLILPRDAADLRRIKVTLVEDLRWSRCDIKSTALLANAMARAAALRKKYDDVILYNRDGYVTEASAANAWIVKDGCLHTHPADHRILAGITRQRLLALSADLGIPVVEAPFGPAELLSADEAFISSATALVTAITHVDGEPIGQTGPGPVTHALFQAYLDYIRR